jgi:hypothetical protein
VDLEGLVVDAHGHPVPGATICLDDDARTTSDADGRFVFADKPAGRYWLRARKDDLIADNAIATLYEGRGAIVLTVVLGISVRVRVLAGGAPLTGARVTDSVDTVAVSDTDGLAVVRGVGDLFQMFTVEADGYAPARLTMSLSTNPGGTIERTIVLGRGAALGGVVVRPDGEPVAGETLYVRSKSWSGETIADANGVWQVPIVGADRYAIARRRPYAKEPAVVVETDGMTPRTDVVVRIPRDGTLVATIVDRNGVAVERPVLIAIRADVEHPEEVEGTDERGVVQIDGLSPAPYDVYAHDRDRGSAIARVTVTGGETARVELVVEPTAITGVVVDANGAAVAGADVSIRAAPVVCCDVTDPDGRFRLDRLPPGTYDVEARRPDHHDHGVSIVARCTAGDRDAVLVIPLGATLRGRVVLDGAPLAFFGVGVTTTPEFPWIAFPIGVHDADGRFALTAIAAGTWGLLAAGPGTRLSTVAGIELAAGADVDVGEIHLTRGVRLTGRVRDANGASISGARVVVGTDHPAKTLDPIRAWFRAEAETVTGTDGTFVLDGVASMRGAPAVEIAAWHASYGAVFAVARLDTDAPIELTLVETGEIAGVVFGFGGGYASIFARRRGERRVLGMAQIDPAGTFAVTGLPPGEYEIEMLRGPRQPVAPSATVTVAANERATVRLAMPSED